MKNQQKILSLLANGLEAARHQHTLQSLGDRGTYLGMSDLALGLRCPRAVVARKVLDKNDGMGLNQLIRLSRGHWLEHGIEEALAAVGQKFISQLEISVEIQVVSIKAHLDLVLIADDGRSITVLELKSSARRRDQVYGTHEAQLYGQLGLLQRFWSQSVFKSEQFGKGASEHVSAGFCSFPELTQRQFGIKVPVDVKSVSIRGFVLTVSPDEACAFGPYEPNDKFLEVILSTGVNLWQRIEEIRSDQATLHDISHQHGFDPLCEYCTDNRNCPNFQGPEHPELEPELSDLVSLKEQRSRLDDEIKEREEQLKAIAAIMKLNGRWINGLRHRFKIYQMQGRVTIDQAVLNANIDQLKRIDREQLLAAMASAQKIGRQFERLQLSSIN
ncbi:hypothetical protein C4J81_01840 [Deltaproteobacteria bacterium Smac51]|nr:hypothetical protein C4J81_01840 [Deltaproteobacteria bacterium Smac51]